MDLRPLGRTGVHVSQLCLGTMTFGNEADERASAAILDRYLDVGGNFVDTSNNYSQGASEEILGRHLGARRHRVVLATKVRSQMGDDPNDAGASRRNILAAVEASLRRLQTDWIDLYQVHWPDFSVGPEETFGALDDLVRSGKVRYVGVSNYLGSQLASAIATTAHRGWAPVVSLQPQYSLVVREAEWELLPLCQQEGLAVLPWSPLGSGLLTGKYRPGQAPPPDTRIGGSERLAERHLNERNFAIAAEVDRVAAATGRSSAQVALNWVLHR